MFLNMSKVICDYPKEVLLLKLSIVNKSENGHN